MTELHVLRVFVGPDGSGGNPLGVFLDGATIPAERRQAVAADLGFSETVFVDDAAEGAIRIFTPAAELPFAGHPTVGTAWLLRESGAPADVLRPPAAVDRFRPPAMGEPGIYIWAWLDEPTGVMRSRYFPTDFGIAEDEATGAAAVTMGGRLRRDLTIRQGVGSEILVRPQDDGTIEIGGRVELVEKRGYQPP